MCLGKKIENSVIEQHCEKQSPGNCCALVYTSGTTGNPKGVMLSHDNFIFGGLAITGDIMNKLPESAEIDPHETKIVSYLPLSHIAGLTCDLIG